MTRNGTVGPGHSPAWHLTTTAGHLAASTSIRVWLWSPPRWPPPTRAIPVLPGLNSNSVGPPSSRSASVREVLRPPARSTTNAVLAEAASPSAPRNESVGSGDSTPRMFSLPPSMSRRYRFPRRQTRLLLHRLPHSLDYLDGVMQPAAFLDLDKTIIAKSSTLAFTKTLFKAGFLTRTTLAKAGIARAYYQAFGAGQDQLERIKDGVAALTKGWNRDEVVALIAETVGEIVAPLVYTEALAIIDVHRQSGRRVVVLSASPEEIVRPLCKYLGISEVIATRAGVDEDGNYTGEIEFYPYGPAKAEAMIEMARSHGIDLDKSFAYSDSATDLPMLEAVGYPVAVNPDAELERIATERGWEIRHFRAAVTLRDRVAGKALPGVAVAGGVAAVAYMALKGKKK